MSIVAAALITLTPVSFHTQAQQAQWLEDWGDQVTDQGHLTLELLEERWDFINRHIPPAPPPVRSQSSNVHRGVGGNVEQWRGLVTAHFPATQVDRALCIINHESGGNPNALNPSSGAAGLFQVMPFWWGHYGGNRFDPARNTQVARLVWDQQGWAGWSPYKRGSCR